MAFSGHKMLGPSGTGVLYGKLHLLEELEPFVVGGDTVVDSTYTDYEAEEVPARFEAGLQNYAGILGLAEAVRYLTKVGVRNIAAHVQSLNRLISGRFADLGVEILGNTDLAKRSSIVSFNIQGLDPHMVAGILDASANIMIRSGMHCVHSWFNAHGLGGSARISLYLYNSHEECEVLVEEMEKICALAR
jgi:cysteine desulfurase/selenocysteine lyase